MSKLFDSIDLVVFGLVLLLVGMVLGTGHGSGGDIRAAAEAELAEARAALEKNLAERSYADDPGRALLEEARKIPAEVKGHWEPQTEAVSLREGLFRHPDSIRDLAAGRDLALRFHAPVDLGADATPGLVRIGWSRPEGNTVEASGYRIYRAVDGGSEEPLARIGPELRFEDRDVEPGRLYRYRVAALTEDPAMVRLGRTESEPSLAIELRGARDFAIEPRLAAEDGTMLRFLVKKLVAGVWYEKEFETAAGTTIGAVDPGSGVDYGTNCRFLRVEVETRMVPEERDEVLFDAEGRVRLEAGRPITRRVGFERELRTRFAVIANERGEEERLPFEQG